ncbi:hypothetical protein ALC60_05027, partial [Trachymyrmex zeteki]
ALAIKYGGNSPSAVPAPHSMASTRRYGGSGKFRAPHSYAAIVTAAMCGPKYNTKVCKPVPRPTLDNTPNPTQYNHHIILASHNLKI